MAQSNDKSMSRGASAVSAGARSMVRSILASGKWVRRAIWIWPIIAAVMLGTVGWFLRGAIETKIKEQLADELKTVLSAEIAALKLWMKTQETEAAAQAADPTLISFTESLVALAAKPETTQLELLQAPELKAMRAELGPVLDASGYTGWIVVDRSLRIVASKRNEIVGLAVPAENLPAAERAMSGQPTVTAPHKSVALLPARDGQMRAGVPTMFACAPMRDAQGEVFAVLGLRIDPQKDFSEILSIARCGQTGETYAFNRLGIMLSRSRFDEELRNFGLLREDEESTLNITLRDPGVDLTRQQRTSGNRSDQPLTVPVQAATSERAGVDVVGYRDYRGSPSVGAWTWLPEYGLGIVTEQDSAEAFAVLRLLRIVFWSMFALLAAASAAIFATTLVMARMNRQAQQAALEAKQLGQYTLDAKLGEGGMGVVYRAHHAMLHRPTAVKFLSVDKTNEHTVARFEREVQLTSQLTHPNTIAIYDFGRTPEGIFYYAMEYLEGINLDDLVVRYGPQPVGRVIHLLQQVCGSLAEAHGIGLIHRDIKPANVILTRRGGIFDFVKLLDFGLVKAVDEGKQAKLTAAGSMAGTPLYLSPEAIENPDDVDARSDLYAVGAVGYFLLTGTPPFDGKNVVEILQKHLSAAPDRPSDRLGRPVQPELEAALLKCLAKKVEDRWATARDLLGELARLAAQVPWSQSDAENSWNSAIAIAGATTMVLPTKDGSISATLVLHTPVSNSPEGR